MYVGGIGPSRQSRRAAKKNPWLLHRRAYYSKHPGAPIKKVRQAYTPKKIAKRIKVPGNLSDNALRAWLDKYLKVRR